MACPRRSPRHPHTVGLPVHLQAALSAFHAGPLTRIPLRNAALVPVTTGHAQGTPTAAQLLPAPSLLLTTPLLHPSPMGDTAPAETTQYVSRSLQVLFISRTRFRPHHTCPTSRYSGASLVHIP